MGLLGTMYFAGWAIACIVVPRMGDIYGRKWPFLISSFASVVFFLAAMLSQSLNLSIVIFFFFGMCCPGKAGISYVYLLEFIPKKYQTYVGTVTLFADGSTMIILSIYFRFISKHWLYFEIYAITATALCTFLCLVIPESPKFLYSVRQYKRAKLCMSAIAKYNKVQFSTRFRFDTEDAEKNNSRKSIQINHS